MPERRECPGIRTRGLLAALILPLLWPSSTAFSQRLPEPAENAAAGARVFGAKGCVSCHAVRGLGGREAPDLGSPGQPRSFDHLAAALWNHVPRMSDQMRRKRVEAPRLSPREVGDLFAFLYTIDYFDPPGDVDAGRSLFLEKRCVMCHQVEGVGGVVGPDLDAIGHFRSPISVAAAMWNHGPQMTEEMRARGIERPSFTARELRDLTAYLEAASNESQAESMYVLPGRAEQGRALFSGKGCAGCHGATGRGARGPALAGRSSPRGLVEFAAALWNKTPGMTRAMREGGVAVPSLTDSEMADIVAYLFAIGYFAESGDAARGRRVVQGSACGSCHGNGRAGAVPAAGSFDDPSAVVAGLWTHLRIERPGPEWPVLTPQAMADLITYLAEPAR